VAITVGQAIDVLRDFAPEEYGYKQEYDNIGLTIGDESKEVKRILCCSEGTRFSKLIDEMVEIETKGTNDYLAVLEKIGRPAPHIDERLEHILITGMFNTFFEMIIHEMPLEDAKHYLKEMRAFYTAGWMKIMGQ